MAQIVSHAHNNQINNATSQFLQNDDRECDPQFWENAEDVQPTSKVITKTSGEQPRKIPKPNQTKRRYFTPDDTSSCDDTSDVDLRCRESPSLSSSSSFSASRSCMNSTVAIHPYLPRQHPYELVEYQYQTRLLQNHQSTTAIIQNQIPKGYREIPAPTPSLQSPLCKSGDIASLHHPSSSKQSTRWISLDVYSLRHSRKRHNFCQLCLSFIHDSSRCPSRRCQCCGLGHHANSACPNSTKLCSVCGVAGHDDETSCPAIMMENSVFRPPTSDSGVCCIQCGARGHYLCPNRDRGVRPLWSSCCHCGIDTHVYWTCQKRKEFARLRELEERRNSRCPKYQPPAYTFAGSSSNSSKRFPRSHHHDHNHEFLSNPQAIRCSSDLSYDSHHQEVLTKTRMKSLKKSKEQKQKVRKKQRQQNNDSNDRPRCFKPRESQQPTVRKPTTRHRIINKKWKNKQ